MALPAVHKPEPGGDGSGEVDTILDESERGGAGDVFPLGPGRAACIEKYNELITWLHYGLRNMNEIGKRITWEIARNVQNFLTSLWSR